MKTNKVSEFKTFKTTHALAREIDKLQARITIEEEKLTFEQFMERLVRNENERLDNKKEQK